MALATTRRHKPVDDVADLDPDVAAKLPPGFSDPRHPAYVEPELRRIVAAFPTELIEKTRWELRDVKGTMIRSTPSGRVHKIEPAQSRGDLDVGVTWRLTDLARRQLAGDKAAAERAAADDLAFRCQICREVRTPTLTGGHTKGRALANGRSVHACPECWAVANQIAVAELAAQTIDGRSRAELAADVLANLAP